MAIKDKAPASGLRIGIVGAGVAGLAAAIALRRAGHECEIWERSTFRNETGAAVSLTPNGGRLLKKWGFDSVKCQGTQIKQARRPKGDTLEPMAPTIDFSDVPEKYGQEWFFYHRADMHTQLRNLAVDTTLSGTPSTINLGSQVIDIDVEEGKIWLKNGTYVQKDLIVIADGQHDRLNQKITGVDIPMQRSGQTAYRCLIPMADILSDPVTAPLFENQAPGFWAPALPQKGTMCVTYPCRDNQILNCLIVTRRLAGHNVSAEEEQAIEDWNHPATPEELEQVLDGFHPSVRALMLKSPDIKMYTQMKRDPLPKCFKGKAILIGDACHPMLLTHAQGVSSSLEDAAALETMLRGVPATKGVATPASKILTERLSLFQSLRLPRASATQILTEPIPPGPKALEMGQKAETRIRQFYQGPLYPLTAVPHSQPVCDFFFNYDVYAEAEKVLDASLAASRMIEQSKADASANIDEISLSSKQGHKTDLKARGGGGESGFMTGWIPTFGLNWGLLNFKRAFGPCFG